MKILLISDVHYGFDMNSPKYGGINHVNTFGSQFEQLFQKLKNNLNNCDLIVNLGDAIAYENPDNNLLRFEKFLHLFNQLNKNALHIVGNHDACWLGWKERAKLTKQINDYFSFDLNKTHHLVLYAKEVEGHFIIDDRQLNWLKEDLRVNQLPVIVYCHHPCDEQDIESNYYFKDKPDRVFIEQKEELRKILEDSGKVKLVISGHTHFFSQSEINGIIYLTVPSLTENDGLGKPCGEYVEIIVEDEIKIEKKKLT